MRQLATTLMSGLVLALVFTNTAPAQERTDVVWARFFDGQGMTIDGQIDEAVWDQAESFTVEYGTTLGLPGSGWWFGGDGSIANPALTEPTDPPTATIRLLASGDSLYIAGEVADKSIGGARGLWDIDAIFLPIRRPGAFGPSGDGFHWFNTAVPEIMLGWWNPVDTTDAGLPLPGVDPYPHTRFEPFGWGTDRRNAEGQLERIPRTEEQMRNWEIATSIDGITNDDTHGEDNGWTFEMKINLAELGYNLDDPDGEIVEFGLAVQDADYWWPRTRPGR